MGKNRLMAWGGLAAAAAAAVWFAPEPASEAPPLQRTAPAARTTQDTEALNPRLATLPSREALPRAGADPFSTQSWAPPAARPVAAHPVEPQVPTPPPMPYRVAGHMTGEGGPHVVLAKGDRVYAVREGETLEGGYRVEAITPHAVTLVYTPLNVAQHLPVAAGMDVAAAQPARTAEAGGMKTFSQQTPAAEQGPAKLRWEGPQHTRAGSTFDVTLKVTSPEPVRSAPLQLSFDASLLEAVEVRRGGFFSDGSFSYRINPSGSIFIGASGKGEVAADAEFFVVTFKPVKPGGTAELKLSSVLLQGAAGRAIAHDQPGAFRTAITR